MYKYILILISTIALFSGCGEGGGSSSSTILESDTPVDGSISVKNASYEGIISKAQISAINEGVFSESALNAYNTSSTRSSEAESSTIVEHAIKLVASQILTQNTHLRGTIHQEYEGSCGGMLVINGNGSGNSGNVTYDFLDYCTAGITMSGTMQANVNYPTVTTVMNIVASYSTKNYEVLFENYKMEITFLDEDMEYFELSMNGNLYYSPYGGVIVTTLEPFQGYISYYGMSINSGKMKLFGKNNSSAVVSASYGDMHIESDYDGDGVIDNQY